MASPTDDDFFTSAVKPVAKAGPAVTDDNFFVSALPAKAPEKAPEVAVVPAAAAAPESWPQAIGRHILQGGDAVARGLLGTAGLPGTIDTFAGQHLSSPNYRSLLPTSAELQDQLTKGEANPNQPGGAVTQDYLAPRNAAERYGTAAARGLGGTAPFLGLGMAPGVAFASGLGGGLGGQAGKDVGGTPGEIAGSIAGGGMGQGLATAIGRQSLGKIAGQLGQSDSLQAAGTTLQEQLSHWAENVHPEWQHQIWAPIDAAIPGNTPTPLTNFTNSLKNIKPNVGPLQGLSDELGSATVNSLQKAMGKVQAAPTWENASAFRSQLGEILSNPKMQKDLSDKQLSRLYSSLTDDMRTTAHGMPPLPDGSSVGAAFDDANSSSQALFSLVDKKGPVSKVLNDPDLRKNTIAPEKAAGDLLSSARKGSTTLDQLRMIAPEGVDELAAAHLRQPNSSFHGLPEASQQALISSPLLREQAIQASRATAGESLKDVTHTGIGILASDAIGSQLGTMAATGLGHTANAMLGHDVGGFLGITAPFAYKAGKHLLREPERLQGAGLGLGLGLGQQ